MVMDMVMVIVECIEVAALQHTLVSRPALQLCKSQATPNQKLDRVDRKLFPRIGPLPYSASLLDLAGDPAMANFIDVLKLDCFPKLSSRKWEDSMDTVPVFHIALFNLRVLDVKNYMSSFIGAIAKLWHFSTNSALTMTGLHQFSSGVWPHIITTWLDICISKCITLEEVRYDFVAHSSLGFIQIFFSYARRLPGMLLVTFEIRYNVMAFIRSEEEIVSRQYNRAKPDDLPGEVHLISLMHQNHVTSGCVPPLSKDLCYTMNSTIGKHDLRNVDAVTQYICQVNSFSTKLALCFDYQRCTGVLTSLGRRGPGELNWNEESALRRSFLSTQQFTKEINPKRTAQPSSISINLQEMTIHYKPGQQPSLLVTTSFPVSKLKGTNSCPLFMQPFRIMSWVDLPRICCWSGYIGGSQLLPIVFFSMIKVAHSNENLGAEFKEIQTAQGQQQTKATEILILWGMIGGFSATIPVVAPRLIQTTAISTSSITAFTFALAMSVTKDQTFPNIWAGICSGISIGCSLWLLRITRARTNSVLVAFLRYIIPSAVLWEILCDSELGNQSHYLDLSIAIPCLSILGSVSGNALINEKAREFVTYLDRIWDKILVLLQLRRIRPRDEGAFSMV